MGKKRGKKSEVGIENLGKKKRRGPKKKKNAQATLF